MAIPQAVIGGEMNRKEYEPMACDATAMPDWNMLSIKYHGIVRPIPDAEWDEIHKHYHQLIISQHHSYPFPQYLKELISLTGEGK
jgi:hypothetical protein